MLKKCAVSVALALAGAASHAAPITFTFTGNADFVVAGNAYQDADFTVTLQADTDDVSAIPQNSQYLAGTVSGTLSLSGLGTSNILSTLFIGHERQSAQAGLGHIGFGIYAPNPAGLLDVYGPAYTTYDTVSNFGPVTGSGVSGAWNTTALATGWGDVYADNLTGPTTVTASLTAAAVPEPETLALFTAGLAALGLRRRKAV